MKNYYKACLVVLFVICISNLAFAGTDTIRVPNTRLLTKQLKPGLKQYIVYHQTPSKPKTLFCWFWVRNITLESRNGKQVFVTNQHWYGQDTVQYRTVYSINNADDFSPVYHSETVKGIKGAYNWGANKITGADSVAANAKKDFNLDFKEPNLNWNLDIETFEMLPLAEGKVFAINFYDAGLEPPKYEIYKVTGSEVLTTMDDHQVDCWILTGGGEKIKEKFWISKKNHEFLKEEDEYGGNFRYKVKLPASSADFIKRFTQP